MPVFLSPGVAVREIDLSLYTANLSTTATGMVGLATKGPINVPQTITTQAQFAQVFGDPSTSFFGPYGALQYLHNGQQLTYVRVAERDPDPDAEEPYLAKSANMTLVENAVKATVTGTVNTLVTITSSSNTLTFVADGATPGFSVVFPLGGAASLQLSPSSIMTTLNQDPNFKQYFVASLSSTGSLKIERLVAGQNHKFVVSGTALTGMLGVSGSATSTGTGLVTEKPFITGVNIFATPASTVVVVGGSKLGFALSSGGSPSNLDVPVTAGTYTADQLVAHLNLVAAGFATHLIASNFSGQVRVQVKSGSPMTTLALRVPSGTNINNAVFSASPVVLGAAAAAGASLKVTAKSPGTWGNGIGIQVANVVTESFPISLEALTDAQDTSVPPVYKVSAQRVQNFPIKRNSVTLNWAGQTIAQATDDGNGVIQSWATIAGEVLTPGGVALIGTDAGSLENVPVVPNSLSITWTGGTPAERPAVDNGLGVINDALGAPIGTINYTTGAISAIPVGGFTSGSGEIDYSKYTTVTSQALADTAAGVTAGGTISSPVKPNSISITWSGGNALQRPATDNGLGVIRDALTTSIGTINYATGAITLTPTTAYTAASMLITFQFADPVANEPMTQTADTATGSGYMGTVLHFPVKPTTVSVAWTGAANSPATDAAGDGVLKDAAAASIGTINYTTGVLNINPTAGYAPGSITVGYQYGVTGTIDYQSGVISIQPPGSIPTAGSATWGGYTPGSVRISYTYEKTSFDLNVYKNNVKVDGYSKLVKTPTQVLNPVTGNYIPNPKYVGGENGPINGVSPYITVIDGPVPGGAPVPNPLVPQVTSTPRPLLSGGTDGAPPASNPSIYIGVSNAEETTGLQVFRNPESYDVNLLLVPGVSDAAVPNEMISICETRADCMCIIDPPFRTPTSNRALTPSDVVDWINGTGEWAEDHSAFDSSYAATYWPWQQIYDSVNNVKIYTPPSGHAAAAYAYSDFQTEAWFAPAGLNRGHLVSPLLAEWKPTSGELDLLYTNNINPIATFRKDGINIWGQKTLQRATTARDRVNVRRMLLVVEKVIATTSRQLLFEPNDFVTWQSFVNLVEPFLRSVESRRGLVQFAVKCDASTNTPDVVDRNEIHGTLYLKPTKTAEFFQLSFVVTTQGAKFEELIF